jgi:transposase-like protein
MKDWPLRRLPIMPRRKRRTFTAEFKAHVVLDLLSGKRSQAELCREHQLSPSLLALWKDTFQERLPLLFEGEERLSQERGRIAQLEQLVGRQALELEILKKASGLLPGPMGANGRSS